MTTQDMLNTNMKTTYVTGVDIEFPLQHFLSKVNAAEDATNIVSLFENQLLALMVCKIFGTFALLLWNSIGICQVGR